KMSKSKGNGIDPIVMIQGGTQKRFNKDFTYEGYGADAVRYTLCALTTEGQDIKLSPTRFEMGRNFINKVWNASRFVFVNLTEIDLGESEITQDELRFEDKWILSRLNAVVEEMNKALDNFKYSDLSKAIYDFTWRDYCDWYVEITKTRLRDGGRDAVVAGRVLAYVLDGILRLLHPIAPFFTEEVWKNLASFVPARGLGANPEKAPEFLMLADWPEVDEKVRNVEVETTMNRIQDVIRAIRNVRAKFNIGHKADVDAFISVVDENYAAQLNEQVDLIRSQAGAGEITIGVGLEKPHQAAAEVMEGAQLFVPLSGLMDVEVERTRIAKELEKKEKGVKGIRGKLQNQQFMAKAPQDVVEREQERLEELTRQIQELKELETSLED
ncbi:MAG: class I tRNA ligase family protein, partial [Planctomycetes bacterium]|nr:class I tRNA ligase family protein [Planctomycetota bacterium]